MKHFVRALAALAAIALLACGMAAAEGALAEAAYLGVWDFVEAEMNGQTATAGQLDLHATLELEPGTAAFINDGSPSFYTTKLEGDSLVLSNDTGRYACQLDERGYLYMVVAADSGQYVTMYFEKLEDYDGGSGEAEAGEPEDEAPTEVDPAELVNALLAAAGAEINGTPAPTEVPQEPVEDAIGNLQSGGNGEGTPAEAVSGLLDMCRGDAATYSVHEYPDRGWALIASTLESKDTAFVHKYESDYRYSTTTFFLTIDDYQTDAPKVEPELMVTYCRDDAPLNITGVTVAFGGRSFTFTGKLSHNVEKDERGYTEHVHIVIDQHNQDFLGALAQYILDIGGDDPMENLSSARATIILHGDEDVEAELGEGFFQDYAAMIVDPLSRYDLAGCFYEDRGVQMAEGVQ